MMYGRMIYSDIRFHYRFDALSHRSSRSSINVAKVDNLGTVSNTSTPLSGSLENIGGGELLRKIGESQVLV